MAEMAAEVAGEAAVAEAAEVAAHRMLASVVLDIPTQSLDSAFTYAVPPQFETLDLVGRAVVVPFGNRRALGFVLETFPDSAPQAQGLHSVKIKEIYEVASQPFFDAHGAACAQFMAHYYLAPLSTCVRLFTPPGGVPRMVHQGGAWVLEQPAVGQVDDRWVTLGDAAETFTPKKNAYKQQQVIAAVAKGDVRVTELTTEFGSVSACLTALQKKGVVRIEHRRRYRGMFENNTGEGEAVGAAAAATAAATAPAVAADAAVVSGAAAGARESAAGATDASTTNAVAPTASPNNTQKESATYYSVFRVDVEKPQLNAEQQAALNVIKEAYERARASVAAPSVATDAASAAPATLAPSVATDAASAAPPAPAAAARHHQSGEVVLLDGVTGSGKTEVYLRAIEHVLAAGQNALVLVPEISLTPQTVARFRGRFGNQVAVMHSRMSQGERFDQWDFIRSGAARVVVGARSALFTPLANVGAIIIDEEHEGSYKQDSQPRYHARTVACWQAQKRGAVVVLGSATPSFEALLECQQNPHWHHARLEKRANGNPLPHISVVDMAHEFAAGHRSMFSRALTFALRETLAANCKAVFMLNQRGFAKFLLCRDCGFVPTCQSCSTSLTYHEHGGQLVCHHCGFTHAAPATCPKCGSPYLKKFGAGTQRVETELQALISSFGEDFANVDIIRMDADTTKTKGAHQKLLERFVQAPRAVLLGTQMIAKGLDFNDVTLVGVINADTTLHLPDFRAAERTFDLIEQVAGRAGRAQLPGRVIVQTYDAENPAIQAAAHYNRALLLEDELPKRQLLGYPPYVRMANILVWGQQEACVKEQAQQLFSQLKAAVDALQAQGDALQGEGEGEAVGAALASAAPAASSMGASTNFWEDNATASAGAGQQLPVTLLPATPCVLAKLQKNYRWHIVITCDPSFDLPALLHPVFRARKPNGNVRVSVDVDPQSLL